MLLYLQIFEPKIHCHPLLGASLILSRCDCPSRLTTPVATCDGETVQYVLCEDVDHIAREDQPQPAVDSVRVTRRKEKGRRQKT